jgi:reverse gyrase
MFYTPEQVGTCPKCGDLNNSQKATGEMFCRRCTPEARERYERTVRILKLVQKINAKPIRAS